MAARRTGREGEGTRRRTATTPDQREQQIASLAYDLAEEQILDRTASSQVVTYFLKAGSRREELERLKIEHENELMKVKQEAMATVHRSEELMQEAMLAFRGYRGEEVPDDEIYDEG